MRRIHPLIASALAVTLGVTLTESRRLPKLATTRPPWVQATWARSSPNRSRTPR